MKRLSFIFFICLINLLADVKFVDNLIDFQRAIDTAESGDEIVLKEGNYFADQHIVIEELKGNIDQPIIIRAEGVGLVKLTGTGHFKVEECCHLIVDGFYFSQEAAAKSFNVLESQHLRITNCTFDLRETGKKNYWLYISGDKPSNNIRIDHNDFKRKYYEGCFIVVYGPENDIAKHVKIDHNYFRGHYFKGDNGGEAIRYGDSNRQNHSSYAIIENNLFENCNGDVEVISVKSTNLTLRRNTLRYCRGSLVLRHGDSCRVEHNYILDGYGGIRVYGDNHRILGNYLSNNSNYTGISRKIPAYCAIAIGNGDRADLANGQNTYDQPENCIVAYNTLFNNLGDNITLGVFGTEEFPAKNITVANNIVVSENNPGIRFMKPPETLVFLGNILFGKQKPADVPESGYQWIDPELKKDQYGVYHLTRKSPAIDTAVDLPDLNNYHFDIDGQNRKNNDIGADEYSTKKVLYHPLTEKDVGPVVCSLQEKVIDQDFENIGLGPYTDEKVVDQWKSIKWSKLYKRAEIVMDNDPYRHKVLTIHYPKGSVGPKEGGGQFVVNIPPANEYWLSYDVKFDKNFDFRIGGKLPGLTSGGAQYTGGHKPEKGEGWSARFMWRKEGKAVVYFYSIGMESKWGVDIPLNGRFKPGKWHRITQHIILNENSDPNGILEVWLDGEKVLYRKDIIFRLKKLGKIDTMYFSTFFGGNTKEWGPNRDCLVSFDNFRVW